MAYNEMSPADIAAVTGNHNSGYNNSGFGWGGDWASWIILFLIFGMFGWGGRGNFGGGGNNCGYPCATQGDVRAAVDQQTLISKLDQQTYGLADTFTALNNTLNSNFRGVDNAICNLGFQNQQGVSGFSAQLAQCCCDIQRDVERNTTQGIMNTNAVQRQISDCCCDLEKANMQSRFDAQTYNCNTLQAIDKLGDRIIDYMAAEKTQALRDENQALRLAASQRAQDDSLKTYIGGQFAYYNPRPVPSYDVPAPYPYCYGNNRSGCGCGNNYGYGGCAG